MRSPPSPKAQQLSLSLFPFDDLLEAIYSKEIQSEWYQKGYGGMGGGTIGYHLIHEYGFKHEDIDQNYIDTWLSERKYRKL